MCIDRNGRGGRLQSSRNSRRSAVNDLPNSKNPSTRVLNEDELNSVAGGKDTAASVAAYAAFVAGLFSADTYHYQPPVWSKQFGNGIGGGTLPI